MRSEAREVGDVARMVSRQTLSAYFMCKTQPPEMLHGAGLGRVGLRVESRAGFRIHQQTTDAALTELVDQHQSARAATGDQDIHSQ